MASFGDAVRNIVISGLSSQGAPRQVLDSARSGRIELFTTAVLLSLKPEKVAAPTGLRSYEETMRLAGLKG